MKKINSFLSACKALGIKPQLPPVSKLSKSQGAAVIAHYKLLIIAEALNEGWKPNWKDSGEYKWYPWFQMQSSSGFRFVDALCCYSLSRVGSRLCFKSEALAKYAGTKFKKLYKEYMLF